MEIVRQQGEPFDAIFVEVGGSHIAGISAYIKALWPQTRVVGVEPHDTPTLHAALAAGGGWSWSTSGSSPTAWR